MGIRIPYFKPSFLLSFFCLSYFASADIHFHDKDQDLYSFVTRPDLRAPKWEVNITEPDLVSPGYWFVAPFEFIDQHEPGNGWVGAHIYDGNGELVWSGVDLSKNWDVIDFKMSNVRGEDLMTLLVQREGNGYILDNTYQIRETVNVGTLGRDFNSHEFYFIENGTRAIVMDEGRRDATKEQALAVDYDKNCRCLFNGFKELDTETWEPLFEWSSFEHIPLEDSTFLDGGVDRWCNDLWGWDFVHLNSVDKDQNGDYFVSARHTDTIYKVSKDDGHIMWKLHGRQDPDGEWDMDGLTFSRQHNVRFRGFNGTHEFISILDNANGQDEQEATHELSRGLMLSLRPEDRTVRIESVIEHPDGPGAYAPRRGNYQIMPNGHIFMGWSEQARHSEHDANGKLLMHANLLTEWLGTYRSYKFPFEGRPTEPPRAVSVAYASKARNSTTTLVHVSWNGATEVAHYKLYKTTETGKPEVHIMTKKKTGFETAIAWDGYASYVIVEALDKHGEPLGRTEIVHTVEPRAAAMSEAVAEETYWMQEVHGENEDWRDGAYPYDGSTSYTGSGWAGRVLLFFGFVFAVGLCVVGWRLKGRGFFRNWRYSALSDRDQDDPSAESGHRIPKRGDLDFRDSS